MGSLTRKGARRFAVALAAESCMSTFDVLMSGCPLTCVMCSFLSVGETAGPLTRFDHHASKSWTAPQRPTAELAVCAAGRRFSLSSLPSRTHLRPLIMGQRRRSRLPKGPKPNRDIMDRQAALAHLQSRKPTAPFRPSERPLFLEKLAL